MSDKSSYVIVRLAAIQKELETLRRSLEVPRERKNVKLEGLWKGVEISEAAFEKAKHSLFREAYQFTED